MNVIKKKPFCKNYTSIKLIFAPTHQQKVDAVIEVLTSVREVKSSTSGVYVFNSQKNKIISPTHFYFTSSPFGYI